MIDFIAGLALGTAFAPFWMLLFNSYIKPLFTKEVATLEADVASKPTDTTKPQ